MAIIVKINKKVHKPNMFDSDTGKTCKTEKVMDITADCPTASEEERVFLLFTRAKRGRIAQIVRPNKGEAFRGVRIHFFVDELEHEMRVRPCDDTLGSTADELGLTKQALRELIEANVPA